MKHHDPDKQNDYCECGKYISWKPVGETVLQTRWILVDITGNEECES